MQGNNQGPQDTVRLTGGWERSGKFGNFTVGTIKLSELQEALATVGAGDEFELIISPVREKKSESSPDYNINVRKKYVKAVPAGNTQAPAGGFKKVANAGRGRSF